LFKQGEYKLIAPAKPIFSYFLSDTHRARQAFFLVILSEMKPKKLRRRSYSDFLINGKAVSRTEMKTKKSEIRSNGGSMF